MTGSFRAVAVDVDGTLTEGARPDDAVLDADADLRATGVRIILHDFSRWIHAATRDDTSTIAVLRRFLRSMCAQTSGERGSQVARIQMATKCAAAAMIVKACHTSWYENTVGRSVGHCLAKPAAPTM